VAGGIAPPVHPGRPPRSPSGPALDAAGTGELIEGQHTVVGQRSRMSPDPPRLAAKCRPCVLDVDRVGRVRHDARAAGETPSALLIEGPRSRILGECPEARLLNIHFAKPIESQVVKLTSDASIPELWHYIQGLQEAVAQGDHSDGLVVLECNVGLRVWVGERRDPVRANRVGRELIEVWWEDVPEARDRGSARDPKTQLRILQRRAHDSHVRRKYCD
jgi:hypothetical protein